MPDLSFSDDERERIKTAVAEAERRTAGEIVPFVVARSGRYDSAVWRGASAGAILTGALALLVAWGYDGWGLGWLYSAWGMALAMTVGGLAGALASRPAAMVRLLTPADELSEQVHRRAAEAFLDEEVFDTKDRTGILILVSLLEHRIEVVGDVGINAKVETSEWVDVVGRVRSGILEGDLAGGLVDAIALCGELLHRRGIVVLPDDTDELPDDLRVSDR